MKLMHICKKYPQALGGDAVVVFNLQKQQKKLGYEVVVVTSNCKEISGSKHIYKVGLLDTPAKLDVITFRRLLSLVIFCFRMFSILRQEKPEVIHTHSVDMAFFASFAARLYRIPMVHTFHIVTFYDNNQSTFRRIVELWLAKGSGLHVITAPNNYDVKKLQAAGLRQTILLPNGVDLPFWKQTIEPTTHQDFVFTSIGRLEAQKGYEYLIEAAALLKASQSEAFRILIIGEGSQKTALQELINAHHLEGVVTLVGQKSLQEIRLILAQSDAAVICSLYETTPITLLEAWACRVPVIATSVGILRDAPEGFDAAYITRPKDAQSLMHMMRRCIADAATRSAIAASGQKAAQQYDWPSIAQTTRTLYRSAL